MCYRHAEIVFDVICPECGEKNENYRLTCKACGAELPDCETPEECEEAGIGVVQPSRPPQEPTAPPNPKFMSGM